MPRPGARRADARELKNRLEIEESLRETLDAARLHAQELSLLLIEADRFKHLHDSDGHRTGEEVLRQLGQALQRALRAEDMVRRWEGQEFLVILPRTGAVGAAKSAERLRSGVAALRVDAEAARRVSLTVTVGLAQWGGESQQDLIRRAETALSAGKASGGNVVSSADPRSLRAAGKMIVIV
jgi:two-component system, cell cycle response regulator